MRRDRICSCVPDVPERRVRDSGVHEATEVTLKEARLSELLRGFRAARIAVVGDLIADVYTMATPLRLSREAPVLVVRWTGDRIIPGGAANAVMNLHALGATVFPVGIVGRDRFGEALLRAFREKGIDTSSVATDDGRATVRKTRLLVGDEDRTKQQILRIDREPESVPSPETLDRLDAAIRRIAPEVDGVIFSDYGYDVLTEERVRAVASLCRGRILTADSRRFLDAYAGVSLATPNHIEAGEMVGRVLRTESDLDAAGFALLERLGAPGILITRGNRGMVLYERGGRRVEIPASGSEEVIDVTGAGDTVISVATLALVAGASLEEAARLSNGAAGVVVMKPGAATCSPEELLSAIRRT